MNENSTKKPVGFSDLEETRAKIQKIYSNASTEASDSEDFGYGKTSQNHGSDHKKSEPDIPSSGDGGHGNHVPTSPGGGGGGSGGWGHGLSSWWNGLDLIVRTCLLVVLGFVLLYAGHSWSISQNARSDAADNELARKKAESTLIITKIKVETAEAEQKIAASMGAIEAIHSKQSVDSVKKSASLVTVPISSFSCRTAEEAERGFETANTFEGVQGNQFLVRDGCAWLKFDHEITSVSGEGVSFMFDPVMTPDPDFRAINKGGRNDSPEEIIRYLNARMGQKIHVFVGGGSNPNAYLKIGGKS